MRQVITGVHLERDGDGPVAVATDGRKLLAVRWTENKELEFPGAADETVENFAVGLSRDACKSASTLVKRNKKRPITHHVHLSESSSNGVVPLKATDAESTHLLETRALEGRYPKWRDVLAERTEDEETRISVDPRVLAETLLAMADVATTEYSKSVELRIPKDPNKAIFIVKQGDDRKAHAAVMPMTP